MPSARADTKKVQGNGMDGMFRRGGLEGGVECVAEELRKATGLMVDTTIIQISRE